MNKFMSVKEAKDAMLLFREEIKEHILDATEEPLSYKTAAEFLGVKESTLRTMVSAKKVPFYKKKSLTFFYKSELNQWIRRGAA